MDGQQDRQTGIERKARVRADTHTHVHTHNHMCALHKQCKPYNHNKMHARTHARTHARARARAHTRFTAGINVTIITKDVTRAGSKFSILNPDEFAAVSRQFACLPACLPTCMSPCLPLLLSLSACLCPSLHPPASASLLLPASSMLARARSLIYSTLTRASVCFLSLPPSLLLSAILSLSLPLNQDLSVGVSQSLNIDVHVRKVCVCVRERVGW